MAKSGLMRNLLDGSMRCGDCFDTYISIHVTGGAHTCSSAACYGLRSRGPFWKQGVRKVGANPAPTMSEFFPSPGESVSCMSPAPPPKKKRDYGVN